MSEKKALDLIKKHMSDFGECPQGLEYYGNLIFEAARQGVCVVKKIIEVFESANIDIEVFKKQFNDKYIIDGDAVFHKDKTALIKFESSSNLKKYEIPCYVCSEAFMGCNVEKIVVKKDVLSMGSRVFKNCKNLIEVIFENGETRLDDDCFVGCPETLIIKAPTGGCVEEYAKKYNIKFEGI